jgi:hypothetical protein
MKILLDGVTPVQLSGVGRGRPVIQNLGPGNVYLGTEETEADPDAGFKIVPNGGFEFSTAAGFEAGGVWIASDAADTDVRVISVGD